jgi:hypothetical protein
MRCDSATLDLTRIPTKMRLMLRTGLALVVLLTQLAIAHAAPAQQHRLAVVELRNTAGLRDEEVTYLTDQARTQASKALAGERFLMMTRESIVALLPPGKTLADCAKMQCEVEVGRTIGAECLQEACPRSLRQRREGGGFLLEVAGVSERSNILFHGGTMPANSRGGILLGAVSRKAGGAQTADDTTLRRIRMKFYGTDVPDATPAVNVRIVIAEE